MKITIENSKPIDENIYKVELKPSEKEIFGKCYSHVGNTSIIYTNKKPNFEQNSLQLEISDAVIVNNGKGSDTLIIYDVKNSKDVNFYSKGADEKYLNDAKNISEIEYIARQLLEFARKLHPGGYLDFNPNQKLYIERPENFWAVKFQPRNRSLFVELKGLPSNYKDIRKIKLKEYMRCYSSFIINREEQLEDAKKALEQSKSRFNKHT